MILQMREMYPIMSRTQRERSLAIEESIVKLAVLKLKFATENDAIGMTRIYKQQVEATKMGLSILRELELQFFSEP